MAQTPEAKVKKRITDYFKELQKLDYPVYFEVRQAGGWSYKEGLPDIFGSFYGMHFEIEVKQLTGEARARQEEWERKFKQMGNLYLRPYDAQEVIDLFENKLIPTWKELDSK